MSSNDDEFGGFEEASSSGIQSSSQAASNLPDWLLTPSQLPKFEASDANNNNLQNSSTEYLKQLQDELSKTKEQLIDQQTNYLQLQTQHRQDLDERSSTFNKAVTVIYRDFQSLLERSLKQQREAIYNELKANQQEQENRIVMKLRELNQKYESQLDEKFENKLVEFQENLIKHCESGLEDMGVKIKQIIDSNLRDELIGDKLKFKQTLEKTEKELKSEMEKSIQNYFRNQSEVYKEQIKSGVMQEHLIHKDLIQNKLEKLFKASEEKRRKTHLLFARHMSGLNFFIDNAHKQLGILREAYKDLLKNNEIIDFYGDELKILGLDDKTTGAKDENSLGSSSMFSLKSNNNNNKNQSVSKDNLFDVDDEHLVDENLLDDLS